MITSMMMTVEMMRKKGTVKAPGFLGPRERKRNERWARKGERKRATGSKALGSEASSDEFQGVGLCVVLFSTLNSDPSSAT